MSLKESVSEKKFDLRVRDKFIEDGRLKKEEADQYLNSLPDEMDNAQFDVYEGSKRRTLKPEEEGNQGESFTGR